MEKICGIQLTHAQLNELRSLDSVEPLKLEMIKEWLKVEPIEDSHWVLIAKNELHELGSWSCKDCNTRPEEAAKALKIK